MDYFAPDSSRRHSRGHFELLNVGFTLFHEELHNFGVWAQKSDLEKVEISVRSHNSLERRWMIIQSLYHFRKSVGDQEKPYMLGSDSYSRRVIVFL